MHTMKQRMSSVERDLAATAAMIRQMKAVNLQMQAEEARARKEGQAASRKAQTELEEMRAEARKAQRRWGEIANKMGTLVADIVAPGLPTVFQQVFGLERIDASAMQVRRRHRTKRGWEREFDSVVMAGDILLVTETKSTLRPANIKSFLRALGEIREFLPDADGRHVVGALASLSVHPSLVTAGERQGLLMFGLGTGLLRMLNSSGFQPRHF